MSKMQVCTSMSYGNLFLNNLVTKDRIRVVFDSLISFSLYMVELKKQGKKLFLWKTDAAREHHNMPSETLQPMQPQSQLRQIVLIDNQYHMDHQTNFRSSASPKIMMFLFLSSPMVSRHQDAN
ncbi:hypothetical protein CROQUDRAFT_689237 [Cronartium quercuum f. sp. fusiforme G11]|uniref:Uncharacterized protein n=1 Tax=Cronartium quercuum f. sp. fusiforme G11 TaxID=708437 RepID=A0A9P6T6D8_9BASI|nr:hypothetical protein CROQUDRAFT_689237 [Cronartium quercuum f. sp. fusiforme G11]